MAKTKKWWVLAVKFLLLFSGVVALVVYTDKKGYFEPDQSNNHTSKKWNSFYEFTETNTVDVVLVGNSHCYAGVNPKNLSEAIGANCFVLASPGTSIMDSYYCLEEALERTHPVVAIIETYGISNSENRHLSGGGLSDQFKSFNARKNLELKISSTPMLFSLEQYVPAWSKSIRNHDFIFHDRIQLENNIKQSRLHYKKKNDKLYLGRFVSFTSGIEDTTMMKYDSLGAPVNGALRRVNDENIRYVNKIVELCEQHNVVPVFVTLPMYYRHIENYDAWKKTIDSVITPTGAAWLDLQEPYDTLVFNRDCFENTYAQNQHMTYEGSLCGAYKVAHFLVDSLRIDFPRRDTTQHWHDLFYGEEGYFENYPPREDDTMRTLICKDQVIDSIIEIKECTVVKGEGAKTVFLKVKRKKGIEPPTNPFVLLTEIEIDGEKAYALMECNRQVTYDPLDHYLYIIPMRNDVEMLSIKGLYKSF